MCNNGDRPLEGSVFCASCRESRVIQSAAILNKTPVANVRKLLNSCEVVKGKEPNDFWVLPAFVEQASVNTGVKSSFSSYEAKLLLKGMKIKRHHHEGKDGRHDWVVPSPNSGVLHQPTTKDCEFVSKKDVLDLLDNSVEKDCPIFPHKSVSELREYLHGRDDWVVTESLHRSGAEKGNYTSAKSADSMIDKRADNDDHLEHITISIDRNSKRKNIHVYVANAFHFAVSATMPTPKEAVMYSYFSTEDSAHQEAATPQERLKQLSSQVFCSLLVRTATAGGGWLAAGIPLNWRDLLTDANEVRKPHLVDEAKRFSETCPDLYDVYLNSHRKKYMPIVDDYLVKIKNSLDRIAHVTSAHEAKATIDGVLVDNPTDLHEGPAKDVLLEFLQDPRPTTRPAISWCRHRCKHPERCRFLHAFSGTTTAHALISAGKRSVVPRKPLADKNTVQGVLVDDPESQLVVNPRCIIFMNPKNTQPSEWCMWADLCKSPEKCNYLHAKKESSIATEVLSVIGAYEFSKRVVDGITIDDSSSLSPGKGRHLFEEWVNVHDEMEEKRSLVDEVVEDSNTTTYAVKNVGAPRWCNFEKCLAGSFCKFLHAIEGTEAARELEMWGTSVIQHPSFGPQEMPSITFQALGGNPIPQSELVSKFLPPFSVEAVDAWQNMCWCVDGKHAKTENDSTSCPDLHVKSAKFFPEYTFSRIDPERKLDLPILLPSLSHCPSLGTQEVVACREWKRGIPGTPCQSGSAACPPEHISKFGKPKPNPSSKNFAAIISGQPPKKTTPAPPKQKSSKGRQQLPTSDDFPTL